MASDPPTRSLTSSCHHTSILSSKSKDKHDLMVLEWIGLTFHICRANSNGGLLPRTIIGPNGVQMVAPIKSSSEPSDPHRDDVHQLLQERDEARAWYSNAARDLGRMDFDLNALQDALTISKNRANSIQMRLAEAKARIVGEIAHDNSYFHNPDLTKL